MNGDVLTSVLLLLSGSAIVRIIGPFVLRATLGRGSLATVAFDLKPVGVSFSGGNHWVMILCRA